MLPEEEKKVERDRKRKKEDQEQRRDRKRKIIEEEDQGQSEGERGSKEDKCYGKKRNSLYITSVVHKETDRNIGIEQSQRSDA